MMFSLYSVYTSWCLAYTDYKWNANLPFSSFSLISEKLAFAGGLASDPIVTRVIAV